LYNEETIIIKTNRRFIREVDVLDKSRAREIATSSIMANVTYNGTRVYIESVNENTGTAYIHPLNQPNNRQEVPITSLVEH
jgi:small acid-soluble spore protein H (minor)